MKLENCQKEKNEVEIMRMKSEISALSRQIKEKNEVEERKSKGMIILKIINANMYICMSRKQVILHVW